MNILSFPQTSRSGDRKSGPTGTPCAETEAGGAAALSDARILHSLSVLNRPILDAVMSRRPRAQQVLTAFQAEWTPPRLRMPRPANDATTA